MALGTLTVTSSTVTQDNTQRYATYRGTLAASAFGDTYPVGGFPLSAVLLAALIPSGTLQYVRVWSASGSGYVYQYIPSTGRLMVLQVPPTGSLTTAAPLQQLPSSANSMSGVFNDVILFEALYLRNM